MPSPLPTDPHRERVRPAVALAALAALLASIALAIAFGRFLQTGGAGELARMLAERGSVEVSLGHAVDAGLPPVDAATPRFALGPEHVPSSAAEDPQREASRRSFHGEDAGVGAAPFPETWVRGSVRRVDGMSSVRAGDACWVRVLPVGSGGFNCLVRVTCGETLLYPDGPQQAGYAPCQVEGGRVVSGTDQNTSGRDGDPWLDLDLAHGQLRVQDATPQQGEPYFEQLGATPVPTFSAEISLDAPRA